MVQGYVRKHDQSYSVTHPQQATVFISKCQEYEPIQTDLKSGDNGGCFGINTIQISVMKDFFPKMSHNQ